MITLQKLNAIPQFMPIILISTMGIGLINIQPAQAGFIDFGDGDTGSWKEPSKITIYIPNGLAGNDRMNFEMGINSWVDMLPKISVMYMDGMHPDTVTENFIDVKLVDNLPGGNGTESGLTVPNVFIPDGQTHGMITDATINILNSALGKPNFLKNLGAHEFGHALGLDDDPRNQGARVNVMDAMFTENDPFIAPTKRDKMMADEHYMVGAMKRNKKDINKPQLQDNGSNSVSFTGTDLDFSNLIVTEALLNNQIPSIGDPILGGNILVGSTSLLIEDPGNGWFFSDSTYQILVGGIPVLTADLVDNFLFTGGGSMPDFDSEFQGTIQNIEINNSINSPYLESLQVQIDSPQFLSVFSNILAETDNLAMPGFAETVTMAGFSSVPEPSSILSFLSLGTLGAALILKSTLKTSKKDKTKIS